MIAEIEQQRQAVSLLCRQYRVERLDLFGSAARGIFPSETSDLDFIVRFTGSHADDYVDRYLDFAAALERLFARRVDLLTERAIRNPYFREEVERTRQVVYEERNQEISA